MSEVLEILLEVVFNIIGFLLEVMADAWVGDFDWPDTRTSRIIWGIILILLAATICWELR